MLRILALAVAFLASTALAQDLPKTVDAPQLVVGQGCTYLTTDRYTGLTLSEVQEVVEKVEDKRIVFRRSFITRDQDGKQISVRVGGVRVVTRELNTLRLGNIYLYNPHSYSYKFPLEVGGKPWGGTAEITVVNDGGRKVESKITARAVKFETIEVPAGRFETVKIEMDATYERKEPGGWSGTQRWVYWYSPNLGCSVRAEYTDTKQDGGKYNDNLTVLTAYKKAE